MSLESSSKASKFRMLRLAVPAARSPFQLCAPSVLRPPYSLVGGSCTLRWEWLAGHRKIFSRHFVATDWT